MPNLVEPMSCRNEPGRATKPLLPSWRRPRLALTLGGCTLCACVVRSSPHLQRGPEPQAAVQDAPAGAPLQTGEAISVTVGEQRTVLARGALGLSYFPDMAVLRIDGEPTFTLLVTATVSTYRLTGGDLFSLTSASKVLGPGARGEFDNGYAGISGIYKDPSGVLYGFYHAEDQEDMPLIPGTTIPGFYARIAVASSRDAGKTWQKLGPVVSSAKPKDYIAYSGQADRGAAEPGVLVDTEGRYLYLYYDDHARVGGRGVQISVARADLRAGPPLPGAFRKYRNGAFSDPGIGGMDDVVISGQRFNAGDAMLPHPVRSAYLGCYLMIFNIDAYREWQDGQPPTQSGFYFASSKDAIHWSDPRVLFVDNTVPVNGRSLSWEGSLLWDDATEQSGWLVYGYSESWPKPHYMVARRVSFALSP
jgi:hypothetical protein